MSKQIELGLSFWALATLPILLLSSFRKPIKRMVKIRSSCDIQRAMALAVCSWDQQLSLLLQGLQHLVFSQNVFYFRQCRLSISETMRNAERLRIISIGRDSMSVYNHYKQKISQKISQGTGSDTPMPANCKFLDIIMRTALADHNSWNNCQLKDANFGGIHLCDDKFLLLEASLEIKCQRECIDS